MENLRVRGVDGGVLFVSGELDIASASDFEQAVKSCLDGQGEIVLDLSGVSFLDSTGVRAILLLAKEASDRALILRHPGGHVLKILDLLRIDENENIRVERAQT